jgi:hypothetical protein
MIYEMRHYLIKYGEADDYLNLFREHIVPHLEECGFRLVGAWMTTVGADAGRSDIRYLLQWDGLGHREEANNKIREQPWYPDFAKRGAPHIRYADNRIMEPLDWSPLQ